jgi:DNA-binding GntR family transcriptional regulator
MGEEKIDTTILPLEHTDLTEQTYRVLRGRILRRQFRPGGKISVDEVAKSLGVSRTPVTVALRRLAKERLVEIIPRRGTYVTELTARDVIDLFDIRLMIELYAAEHVIKTGQVTQFLDDIKGPMASMRQAMVNGDYGDYEAFIAGDQDLHLTLVKCTGNQHLISIYSDMNIHIQVTRAHYIDSVERARQAYTEHENILKAFREGQPNEVRQALRSHIETVRERILEILDRIGGKF